ncbi:MAG: hypothetical protein IPJ34_21340 [Myxococcales bacterium]|nr:hypothetical protein [Myxococcales bacterium]
MRREHWTSLVVASLPVALAVWLTGVGCATGDQVEDDGPETGPVGDGGGDTSTGDAKTDGGADAPKDTGLSCPDSGALNTCATVQDMGTIAAGASKSVTSSLPITGASERWYKVTFQNLDQPSVHPRIKISATAGGADAGTPFLFEVMKSCSKDNVTCGDEDATTATKVADFEMRYRDDPDGGDGAPLEDPPDGPDDARIPIKVGTGGTVYIRVFRASTTPPTVCDTFKIDFTN